MLNHLYVRNFAIADEIDIEFNQGMSVITGETGAGKSILLDAIGLTLGDRADSSSVGSHDKKAEIIATFDISKLDNVRAWLEHHELALDSHECLLRRVVSKDGKSKAYINGRPVPLVSIRELGEQLINIHGQHAHQLLLHKDHPTRLIDSFAKHADLLSNVKLAFNNWQTKQNQLDQLKRNGQEAAARIDYLRYQHNEIKDIAISHDAFQTLEKEHSTQQHAETLVSSCQQSETLIDGDSNLQKDLQQTMRLLDDLPIRNNAIDESHALLESARIQIEEAAANIKDYYLSIDVDQQQLHDLDQQLGELYRLAKKYNVAPENLEAYKCEIEQELDSLDISDEKLGQLENEIGVLKKEYEALADQLTSSRHVAAEKLSHEVEQRLKHLEMINCKVYFDLESHKPSNKGNERIALNVSTNPGQAPQAINKVASGGELSRIGLAIQVAAAKSNAIPSLIFDEVDSGVGGAVAEVVGKLMRELGKQAQIFSVTHLPQVAGQAHNHYKVRKDTEGQQVTTQLNLLDEDERVSETARMLGGINITKETLVHAEQMICRTIH